MITITYTTNYNDACKQSVHNTRLVYVLKRYKQLQADLPKLKKSGNKFQIKKWENHTKRRLFQSSNQKRVMNRVVIVVNANSSKLFKQLLDEHWTNYHYTVIFMQKKIHRLCLFCNLNCHTIQ